MNYIHSSDPVQLFVTIKGIENTLLSESQNILLYLILCSFKHSFTHSFRSGGRRERDELGDPLSRVYLKERREGEEERERQKKKRQPGRGEGKRERCLRYIIRVYV